MIGLEHESHLTISWGGGDGSGGGAGAGSGFGSGAGFGAGWTLTTGAGVGAGVVTLLGARNVDFLRSALLCLSETDCVIIVVGAADARCFTVGLTFHCWLALFAPHSTQNRLILCWLKRSFPKSVVSGRPDADLCVVIIGDVAGEDDAVVIIDGGVDSLSDGLICCDALVPIEKVVLLAWLFTDGWMRFTNSWV